MAVEFGKNSLSFMSELSVLKSAVQKPQKLANETINFLLFHVGMALVCHMLSDQGN